VKKQIFSGILAAIILVALAAGSSYAWPNHLYGRVLLPNGDPVVGLQVTLHFPQTGRYANVTTNYLGKWFLDLNDDLDCNSQAYEQVGTQKVYATIVCTSPFWTYFADLILQCGGPKQPPCPHQ
jgi:hypothetical protein